MGDSAGASRDSRRRDPPAREWSPRGVAGIYLRGLCMGAADAVPGVSGGTIALITGIYERLIAAITALTPALARRTLRDLRRGDREGVREALAEVDVLFLAVLVLGVVSAVVAVSGAVELAVDRRPVPTFGFFFGLIAASAVVLARDLGLDTPAEVAAGVAGFVVAFVVSGQAATGAGHALPVVFVAGAIAVSAMILPGISGSLLLLLLGQYTYLTGTVSSLRRGVVAAVTGGDGGLVGPATVAGVFVAGALVGLFTVAHAVRLALRRRREATLSFLVALVAGALRAPLIRIGTALAETGRGWSGRVVAVVAATALAGALVVLAVERAAGGVEY